MRRPVLLGGLAGIGATIVTWALVQLLVSELGTGGLRLEAITGLLAIVVLLVVTNWFFHRVYWSQWIARFNRRRKRARGSRLPPGQAAGLALLGLTSVYREGFETVLFVQNLQVSAGTAACLLGAAIGLAGTLAVGGVTFAAQRKLPYKKMLIATGVLIALVLAVMTGSTVHVHAGPRLAAGDAAAFDFPCGQQLARPLPHLGGHRRAARRAARRARLLLRRARDAGALAAPPRGYRASAAPSASARESTTPRCSRLSRQQRSAVTVGSASLSPGGSARSPRGVGPERRDVPAVRRQRRRTRARRPRSRSPPSRRAAGSRRCRAPARAPGREAGGRPRARRQRERRRRAARKRGRGRRGSSGSRRCVAQSATAAAPGREHSRLISPRWSSAELK